MLPEHYHVCLVHNRAHRRQRSFDICVQKPRAALLAVSNDFQSRVSFDSNGASVCRRQFHCPYRHRSLDTFRLGQTLLAAPESTVISTISCTASTAFTSSSSSLSIAVNARNRLFPLVSSSRPPPPDICTLFSSSNNRIHHANPHDFSPHFSRAGLHRLCRTHHCCHDVPFRDHPLIGRSLRAARNRQTLQVRSFLHRSLVPRGRQTY